MELDYRKARWGGLAGVRGRSTGHFVPGSEPECLRPIRARPHRGVTLFLLHQSNLCAAGQELVRNLKDLKRPAALAASCRMRGGERATCRDVMLFGRSQVASVPSVPLGFPRRNTTGTSPRLVFLFFLFCGFCARW